MSGERANASEVPAWVVTFADLMTLLFCFFVLLTTLATQPKNCLGLQHYLEQNSTTYRKYELRSTKLECILSLPSDYLFSSGQAIVQQRALRELVPLFRKIRVLEEHKEDLMIVEGHTDNVPIRTAEFSNNWELSSSRATNLATFLVKKMKYPGDKVSVRAFAENKPKTPYFDEYGDRLRGKALRRARTENRRVELILVEAPETLEASRVIFRVQ